MQGQAPESRPCLPPALAGGVALVLLVCASAGQARDPAPQAGASLQHAPELQGVAPEDARFFHERVLPILTESCFECHGPARERVKGGLRMAGRDGLLRGGASGPALVPGDPDASLIVQAVRYHDPDLEMPPDERMPSEQIAVLEDWVRRGAPWVDLAGESELRVGGIDVDAGREWWAFRPVRRPEPPDGAFEELVRDPLDAFVFARLAEVGLEPSGPADRRVLARRLWFDLLGLPPTPEEVEAFVADPDPDAYAQLVDRLLARPEYGERWARHWLDLMRFAQTNGYERDSEKPYAWRYRDYVVRALNQDKPYDRFVLEHLAGDELPDSDADSLIATALYRLGAWDDEPANRDQARFDEIDDTLNTISTGFLGVTLACARCHDHKFDPFSQEDYYRMLAFLRSVRPYEDPIYGPDSATLRPLELSTEASQRWEREREQTRASLLARRDALVEQGRAGLPEAKRAGASAEECVATLAATDRRQWISHGIQLEQLERSFEGDLPWTLVVSEAGPEPVPTHLLHRGMAADPGPLVEPGFPRVLCADDRAAEPALPEAAPDARSTGRRSVLGAWIASPQNPLTARVIVNRVWQFHFGRGLVATPDDFGVQGQSPSHPELLDWLASTFMEEGWSLKRLHRRILNSYTWRMASSPSAELAARAREVDPDNRLLWHQRPRRLDAEVLRDSILSVAGTLERAPGGRGFFPAMSAEALSGQSRPGEGWEPDSELQRSRRSLYIFAKRTLPVPFLEVFDGPGSATLPVGKRSTTTVPTQALTLLNGELAGSAARHMARRVEREAGSSDAERVEHAFRLALARAPSEAESTLLLDYLVRTQAELARQARGSIRFSAALPARVSQGYLHRLRGSDALDGPRVGWSYLRGAWGANYNQTLTEDGNRGPAALFEDARFGDGEFRARLRLAAGTRRAGLLLRASGPTPSESAEDRDDPDSSPTLGGLTWNIQPLRDEVFDGLELRLDPIHGTLQLWRHAEAVELVSGTRLALPVETWIDLRVELIGDMLRVWLGAQGDPALEALGVDVEPSGAIGVRLSGGAIELGEPRFAQGDAITSLLPREPGDARFEALQSLCLMLFNLDEFVYTE